MSPVYPAGPIATFPFLELENLTKSTVLCGRDTVQVRPPKGFRYSVRRVV